MATKVKLKEVRISFPDLYEAVEFETGDGKFRYNVTALVEPGSENDKAVKAAIVAECKAKFGEKDYAKKLEAFKGTSNKICYVNGDAKEYDGYAGMMALSAHRRQKDGPVGVYGNVIDPQTGKVVVLTEKSGKPYAGCHCNVTVEIYATDGKFPGVFAGLSAVQFWRDGDAFSGTKAATPDDFEPLAAGAGGDPLGGDDDIAF